MADVRITALPTAQSPLTGTELVPIVQNGLTVQTTVSAITQSPSLTGTFLTVGQQPLLPNSRYIATGTGLGFTDGGAQSPYTIALNGTAASLEGASTGVVVKTAANTIAARTLSTSGNGISVSNGSGVSGDPTFQLTGIAQALANATGTGLLALGSSTTVSPVTIVGVANQISVLNGDGSGNPTIGIESNPVLPGSASVRIPVGTTAQRSVGADGEIRYNSQSTAYEGYSGGIWRDFSLTGGVLTFSAGTTGFAPSSPTSGAVVLSGVLNSTSGGTGASALTGYLYSNGASAATASATIPTTNLSGTITNAQLANSSLTVNGVLISLGGSGTITAAAPNALTIGTGLSGTSYNGSTAVTIAIANTGAAASTYGTAARTITQTVNAQGQITSISDQLIDGISLTTGSISTAPSVGNSIVNKTYVDGLVSTGLVYHQPVQAATTGTLASITGGTVTYNNGASGVGATLTLSVALTTLDGYTLLNTNRILVKDEANQAHNGVYTWATGGTVLTRATDADTYGTGLNQLSQNDYFFTQNGTVNRGISYVLSTIGTITFGTTAITFAEFSTSQVYTAGTGLTLTGTQFSLTSPVTVALGGTGLASVTTNQIPYGNGTSALNTSSSLTFDGTTLSTTTVDATTLEVTNLKAKDGTAAGSIADATGVVTLASSVLTTTDINGGTIDGTSVGASVASSGAFTNFSASGTASFTSTGAVKLPAGTVAQRPTPAAGMLRFNDDTDEFEGYNGTAWSSVGGSAITNDTSTATDVYPLFANATTGTAANVYTSNAKLLYKPSTGELKAQELVATNGIVVNSATVSADYTVAAGSNAMSAGPITIDSGVTVTITDGTWVIV